MLNVELCNRKILLWQPLPVTTMEKDHIVSSPQVEGNHHYRSHNHLTQNKIIRKCQVKVFATSCLRTKVYEVYSCIILNS